MNGKYGCPATSSTSTFADSDRPVDISKLLPLSLCRSHIIPPAPNRRQSAIDFLSEFGGSSWIAYGASSLLVISQFPSPFPVRESLVGPFFHQVIVPPSLGVDDGIASVNAVSWCPMRPSEGEVAAVQKNSICLYTLHLDNDTGSFCWRQTAGILHSSMIEAIAWTGSGDGLVTAGIGVVFWRKEGRSLVQAWKYEENVPQVMVSATWSAEGLVATAASCLFTSREMGAQRLRNLADGDYRHVSVYHMDGRSEVIKIKLYHPQLISSISWRPSTPLKLIEGALYKPRDVLLTCCLDGTLRLWSEIDSGRSKKFNEGIDQKMIKQFHIIAIIEIEQCLNGTIGTDIFIDWAVDMGNESFNYKGDDYSLSSATSKYDLTSSCEWLVSVGPVNLVTLWAIHCLDDAVAFRSPRVTLWKQRDPADFQACNLSYYSSLLREEEEKTILVKVVAMRRELFGPPVSCSLLLLFPSNSMNWWHFYSPSIDDAEQKPLAQVSKDGYLSQFAAGVLNLDGHSASILQLALHPYFHELGLAVSLDSNGFLIFWSLPRNFRCTLGMRMYINSPWKLIGKIKSQGLIFDSKCLTIGWVPFVLDEKPLLLLGYADGIDCFLIKMPGEGEAILSYKIFSLSFAAHNCLDGSPDHIFALPLPSLSRSFLLYGVWMREFKSLSWKVVLHSEVLSGSSYEFSSDSETISCPENTSKGISCSGRRYSAAFCPVTCIFPNSQCSKMILCVSVISLEVEHSINFSRKHVTFDNGSCDDIFSLMATGCSDGILQLWKVYSAKSSESESIRWFLVGEFAAHNGPVNTVSLSNCGGKVATVSFCSKSSMSELHIWSPLCFIGGGTFILEGALHLNGPVASLKWLTIGNGKLILGVCMPNEFHIYCERRPHNIFMESDKLELTHSWCCISISHFHYPCHEFLWGPMLSPLFLHENKISIFSEWLSKIEYMHVEENSSIYFDTCIKLGCDISQKNFDHCTYKSMQRDNKKNGIGLNVFSSESFLESHLNPKNRLLSLMDIVEGLCGPLKSYHPWALLQYTYRGNWNRAYIVLKDLMDSLKSYDTCTTVLESCNSRKPCHIPQIPLSKYLEGMIPAEPESNRGDGSNFSSETFEKNVFQFGEDTLKPTVYKRTEIMGFIDSVEKAHKIAFLTSWERIQYLTVLDVILEFSITSYSYVYESLDEAARRFWVAVKYQQFYFLRKVGRRPYAEECAVESWLVAWAFQSESQENLLNSVLSTEPSWQEMRSLGFGFWFTNVTQLRARMEKLARLQYLKRKNPKDCALLYLALNRVQVLAALFKISNYEKDKLLFTFLSRNFQEEKNKAAALKNAYVLMGRHELELAVAFFLLGGETFSAVSVCAKNLKDEQLALVICRLLEGYGGPLEHQLITSILLPNAIENKDHWLCSLFEWILGNYSGSLKMLLEPSWSSENDATARKCCNFSILDPNIARYCVILASKHCLQKSIGDYLITVLLKFATALDIYSLERLGLPLEALECIASYIVKGNAEEKNDDIKAHTFFHGLLNPFATLTTQTWLQAGFACQLESNIRLNLAMQYISTLLTELPCWTFGYCEVFPEVEKHNYSEGDQYEYHTGELSQKLSSVVLAFERRYSLKLIDLANMVLLFACNNGLLFLGYKLIQGIKNSECIVDNQHNTYHSTLCPSVLELLVKASKELFYEFSRFVVCCHLSDSMLKLLSGRLTTAEKFNDIYFLRNFCFQSLIHSLRIIKSLLKYYDHLFVMERHIVIIFSLKLIEYMMYFSYALFNGNLSGLIQMVYQIHKASVGNYDSIEVMAGELMKLMFHTSDSNPSDALNDDAEVLQDFISKNNQVKQNESLALAIPEDERWLLLQTSLWNHNNRCITRLLNKFLAPDQFVTEGSVSGLDHNKLHIFIAEVAMASVAFVSTSITRQHASFLRKKVSKGLPVGTITWMELTSHHEFGFLPQQVVCLRQLFARDDKEALLKILWENYVNANEIYQNILNERVYEFSLNRKKQPSWKDFPKLSLPEHESGSMHNKSEGTFRTASSVIRSPFIKKILDADTSLETRSDINLKLKILSFSNPSEILNRNGELLEAICCNSMDEQQLAVASNQKGLLFFNWKMELAFKNNSLLVWPEADWPLNECSSLENVPDSPCASSDVRIGSKSGKLDRATRGLGSLAKPARDLIGGKAFGISGYACKGASDLNWGKHLELGDFLIPPTTVEYVSSQTLSSHPSRSILLVGSMDTRIYLWEFGKKKSTAAYGFLPASSIHPPVFPSISSLQFDYCGHRFASTASDGTICTWQLEVEGRSYVYPTESSICFSCNASGVAYLAASGSILAVAGCSRNGQNVGIWDILAPPATSQASVFCHEGGATCISVFDNHVGSGAVSPAIVSGGKDGDVALHDFRYIASRRSRRQQQPRNQILKSCQDVNNSNGMIWYIPKAHSGSITRVTVVPNTNMFLTGSEDGDVKLWDAKRQVLVYQWQKIHDQTNFGAQPRSRSRIGGVVRAAAAITDIQLISSGFLTCGGDGSVKLVQLERTTDDARLTDWLPD